VSVSHSTLVILRRLLTSLQLLHIPAANVQIAVILVHTAREVLDVHRARAGRFLARGGVRVVGAGLGVVEVVVCGGGFLRVFGLGCLTAAAAEEASDCMAYA